MTGLIETTEQTRKRVETLFRALSLKINNRLISALKQLPEVDNLHCLKYNEGEPKDSFDFFILEDGDIKCFLDGEYRFISVDRIEQLLRTFDNIDELISDVVRFESKLLQAMRMELDSLLVQEQSLKSAMVRFATTGE